MDDQIKSALDQMSELDDSSLSELQSSIISNFESIESQDTTPQSVDAMTELANALDTVREEAQRREAEMAELSARASEAASRVHGKTSTTDESGLDSTDTPTGTNMDTTNPAGDVPAGSDPADLPTVPDDPTADTGAPDGANEPLPVDPADVPSATDTGDAGNNVPDPQGIVEDVAPAGDATDPATDPSLDAPVDGADPEDSAEAPETPGEVPDAEDIAEGGEPEGDSANPFDKKKKNAFADSTDEDNTSEFATKTPEAAASAETPVEADASNTTETDAPEAQEEAQTVTAAAEGTFEAPADRRPVAQAVKAPTAITAGADIPGYSVGQRLTSLNEVSEAMAKRLHSFRNASGGDGEQHIVASISTEYPEERRLGGDFRVNKQKIEQVVGHEAIVASGGFAAPLEASYDINVIGTDARPVRDVLPKFQADRGGIRYLTAPVMNSYTNAVGVWTNANDVAALANYDADKTNDVPVKNVLIVGGVQENTAYTDAITLQLQFGNLMTRAFPELIAAHNELALYQHARQAELHLLSGINAASTQVTAAPLVGFARDFLVTIKKAAAAYRSRNRLDGNINLRAIIPTWIMDAISADLTLQMPGDDVLGISRATINGYLAGSGVTLTESLDQNTLGAQGAGALLNFPSSFTWFLFAEGTFLFLDGGTLDLGIVRDSGLVGTNDYRMFTETFEGVAKVGPEALAITQTIQITGAAAALVDTTVGENTL